MNTKPLGAGKSSYDLVDPELVFNELPLEKNITFLDIACGFGKYSLRTAEIIGQGAIIYAIDLWPEGIAALLQEVAEKNIKNIWASLGDVSEYLPLRDNSIDVCLMATVLHDLIQARTDTAALKEISRVIKPSGELAIIEFKKIDGPPGPPLGVRISAEEVEEIVSPCGFRKKRTVTVGPYNYLIRFSPNIS